MTEKKRLEKVKDICILAAYKRPEGPMGDLYHNVLMANIEKEIIKDTPDQRLIYADLEGIRIAYCKLLNDVDEMTKKTKETGE